jgi:murein DD-endopeptidase MepM/ murein hydrolase activator NlpD
MSAGGPRGARLAVIAGVGGIVVAAGVVSVVLVMAVVLFFGGTPDPSPGAPVACGGGSGSGTTAALPVLDSGPRIASLDADQTGNARTIVRVASSLSASHGLDAAGTRRAAIIGIMTAMQESTLRNLNYGDRDSLGLFQQRAAWAGAAERTTPSAAATMFYTGGHAGQRGLFAIPSWQSMPLWAAAQAVQVSAFPTAYAKWERTAVAVVGSLLGGGSGVPVASPSSEPTVRTIALPDSICAAGAGSLDGTAGAPAQPSAKGWVLPLPAGSYTPTSPFGWRVHPILHDWKLHTGQDLGAPMGTSVYAAADGRVTTSGLNGTAGNQVILDHGGGVESVYDHLSVIGVPVGGRVRAGQVLGRVGSTGRSTGAHLHFEIRLHGRPIDPVPFLKARGVQLVAGR